MLFEHAESLNYYFFVSNAEHLRNAFKFYILCDMTSGLLRYILFVHFFTKV